MYYRMMRRGRSIVFTVYHRVTETAFVLAEGPNTQQHWRLVYAYTLHWITAHAQLGREVT